MKKMKTFDYIIVRIDDNVKVLFEDSFIDKNAFRTQNQIIEVLSLLYERNRFEVSLMAHSPKKDN